MRRLWMWTGWIAWFKLMDFVLLVDGYLEIGRARPGDFKFQPFCIPSSKVSYQTLQLFMYVD